MVQGPFKDDKMNKSQSKSVSRKRQRGEGIYGNGNSETRYPTEAHQSLAANWHYAFMNELLGGGDWKFKVMVLTLLLVILRNLLD